MDGFQLIKDLLTPTIIGAVAIALYRIRVHHKVLFGANGELNFVTHKEKDEIIEQEWKKQDGMNKNLFESVNKAKQEKCPVHEATMEILRKVNTTQEHNIGRLNTLDEAIKESRISRDKIHETLAAINTSLATLVANYAHLSSDIKDLKEAR